MASHAVAGCFLFALIASVFAEIPYSGIANYYQHDLDLTPETGNDAFFGYITAGGFGRLQAISQRWYTITVNFRELDWYFGVPQAIWHLETTFNNSRDSEREVFLNIPSVILGTGEFSWGVFIDSNGEDKSVCARYRSASSTILPRITVCAKYFDGTSSFKQSVRFESEVLDHTVEMEKAKEGDVSGEFSNRGKFQTVAEKVDFGHGLLNFEGRTVYYMKVTKHSTVHANFRIFPEKSQRLFSFVSNIYYEDRRLASPTTNALLIDQIAGNGISTRSTEFHLGEEAHIHSYFHPTFTVDIEFSLNGVKLAPGQSGYSEFVCANVGDDVVTVGNCFLSCSHIMMSPHQYEVYVNVFCRKLRPIDQE